MGEGGGVREEGVDLDVNLPVREERAKPFTEGWRKPEKGEEVAEACDVDVVKEALYVEEEEGADQFLFQS